MLSESLTVFHEKQSKNNPTVDPMGAAARRAKLEADVAAFQAQGGQIQEVPSTLMARPLWTFNFGVSESHRR